MSNEHAKEKKDALTEPKAKQILSEFDGRLTLVERDCSVTSSETECVHLENCLIISN